MPVPTSWSQLSQVAANNSPVGSETVGPLANDYFQAAFSFIRQLYDQGGVPNVPLNANNQRITNVAPGSAGTDAVNLNQLNSTWGAPSGTRVVVQQGWAPAGWYVDTNAAFSDASVRFNNTGISSGGSTVWSSWNFGGQFNVNGHNLSVGEMPPHAHGDSGHNHGFHDPGHNHGFHDPGHSHGIPTYAGWTSGGQIDGTANGGQVGDKSTYGAGTGIWIDASGTGCYMDVSYANIQNTGGGAAHGHTFNTPQVKYADVLVIQKT